MFKPGFGAVHDDHLHIVSTHEPHSPLHELLNSYYRIPNRVLSGMD